MVIWEDAFGGRETRWIGWSCGLGQRSQRERESQGQFEESLRSKTGRTWLLMKWGRRLAEGCPERWVQSLGEAEMMRLYQPRAHWGSRFGELGRVRWPHGFGMCWIWGACRNLGETHPELRVGTQSLGVINPLRACEITKEGTQGNPEIYPQLEWEKGRYNLHPF